MHYFIDGYNLLFSLLQDSQNLQSKREALIHDLNTKASAIKLNASIVFDAAFQPGGRSRFHFDALEILYTAEGESADDFILDKIQHSPSPQQETVITSDKPLSRKIRHCSAKTETVEEFLDWLNRSYNNKISKKKEKTLRPLPIPKPKPPPEKNAPLDQLSDHYQQLFEAEYQEIQKKEAKEKELKAASQPMKRPPRQPRQKKDPFQEATTSEERQASELERWLKIFEDRLSDSN